MSSSSSVRSAVSVRATIAIALIWGIATGAVTFLRAGKPNAEEVIGFLRQQNVGALDQESRDRAIKDAALRLNGLNFEEMRAVRQSRALFAFYRPLTPREKVRFAELIVPTGLRRIVEASRGLPRKERAGFLENALYLAIVDLSTPRPQIDPEALERIERDAVNGYLDSLTPEEKDLIQPQIRQIRRYLEPNR